MPLIPGQKLAAYEIISTLGAGGMGEVYRARDARLGRDVALKILPREVTNEPGRLERFDREARAIAALNHPHIVTIYSTEEVDGHRFLTMELVDGCTLNDLILSSGMAIAQFLDIAIPLADALAAAHQKQITHRDLKPGNVMLSNDGRVKVLDFGLARITGDVGDLGVTETMAPITHHGAIVGTVPYMSPEQVEGRPLDARSDLFSIGVIFYELLSGERPFKGSSSPALMSAILRDRPAPITDRRADVPEPIARLVDRLLEKRPDDRWQTARDVFNELRHIRREFESGGARPTGSASASSSLAVSTTVMVMPFVARSADDHSRALADGLADEIASGLSRFNYLRVSSGSGSAAPAKYSVEGQVRRAGTAVRVAVKLVDNTGTTLWAQNYDHQDTDDLFVTQDDVSSRVIATIGDPTGVLIRAINASLADKPLEQMSIPELIIRYHQYAEHYRAEEHGRLRDAFEAALKREPRSAEAWAYLASLIEHEYGFGLNPLPDTLSRQRQAAERAIGLDPRSPAAWSAMAVAYLFARDGNGVRTAVERVVSLNPFNADTIARNAIFLSNAGDHEKAYELVQRAMTLKPHHPGYYFFVTAGVFYARGDYERALAESTQLAMPSMPMTWLGIVTSGGQLGRTQEVRVAIDSLRKVSPALTTIEGIGDAFSRWVPPGPLLDRMMEGARKGLALVADDASGRQQRPSIAVLPFADLSEKKDHDWFCDGVAEEILNALSPLTGLHVAARASSFSFKGKSDDLRTISEKLNVTTVLEGSVRRFGDRVRITTQLSDAREGRQLWSDRFDRELKDIFDVQDEIARAVVERLRVTLGNGEQLIAKRTTSIPAYELLLKGRTLLTRRGPAIVKAVEFLEQAVALDPGLADALAGLADGQRLMGIYGLIPPREAMPKARASLERALAIEPNHADALATLANIKHAYEWDFVESRRLTNRALAVDPNHVRALAESGITIAAAAAELPPAPLIALILERVGRARQLDPLNAWVMAVEAWVLMILERFSEARAAAERAVTADPDNFTAHWSRVMTFAAAGQDAEAERAAEASFAIFDRHPSILAELAAIRASHGDRAAAHAIFDELTLRAKTTYVGSAVIASVAASAGLADEARRLLADAIAERDTFLTYYKLPACRFLRADASCRAMMNEMIFIKNAIRE